MYTKEERQRYMKEYNKKYYKIKPLKDALKRKQKLKKIKEMVEQHLHTIFTGGYDNENETILNGYSEGEII